MRHLIFIVAMLVAGVGAGVWISHDREVLRAEASAAADAAVVGPPPDAAVVPVVEETPPPRAVEVVPVDAAIAHGDDCDEVSCVLDDYARPCCNQYRRPHELAGASPQSLDRTMIADGVNSVKPRIVACAAPNVHGTVKVRVRVAPSGAVTSVTVAVTPDPKLGSCVHDIMTSILFTPTQSGGSFSYPFVF